MLTSQTFIPLNGEVKRTRTRKMLMVLKHSPRIFYFFLLGLMSDFLSLLKMSTG